MARARCVVLQVARKAMCVHPKTGIMDMQVSCHRLKTRGDSLSVRRDVVLARLATTSQCAFFHVVIACLVVHGVLVHDMSDG